ncbi:hypothetical protein NA57DRAFT_53863 [Rhizodiscina lignyota]|uniref:DNA polymerase epsilon subunit B n=1 Tax=Rhizodiscina lignyota TaxID=1504668 RepID=A0A9P4MDR9_9PEZI|nr:hypothetical protein NA57DRAFT_53863 [Rhizodiscina lignyota]
MANIRNHFSNQNPIPSSSPAFATPVHPIRSRDIAPVPAPQLKPTILPILLPPAVLRPHAFRTLTNKYNLNFRPSALGALATFIGRHCGSGWREAGLAEGVFEEVARSWKRLYGEAIIDGDGENLKNILKSLETCMVGGKIVQGKSSLSRQSSFALNGVDSQGSQVDAPQRPALQSETSFGISALNVNDEEDEDALRDPRDWIKLVDAYSQPRLVYNATKKHFERSTSKPSLFPPPSAKTELFRQRYYLVHQRILRNDSFQPPSFSGASNGPSSYNNKITSIANLLGRRGSSHLLLGLLTVLPTGQLALTDLTGAIVLDLQHARPIPADSAYFTPGMIILVDGVYEEEYSDTGAASLSNDGGIGGTIGGKFIASVVGHPPCERRAATLGIAETNPVKNESGGNTSTGPAFGWTDFLGLGSERAIGQRMRRLESRLLGSTGSHAGNGKVVIAAEVNLDTPATLSALRTMLDSYSRQPVSEFPMSIVLMGNFVTHAALSGAPGSDSIEYKEAFNSLAAVLSDFPELIARTTLVLVPGDNDPWPSAFSAGAASPIPRKGIPQHFTNRLTNVMREANDHVGGRGKRKEGCVEWSSNPGRLCWFGGTGEMMLWRDDTIGRMRRMAVKFKTEKERPENEDEMMEGDADVQATPSQAVHDGDEPPAEEGTQPMDVDGGVKDLNVDSDLATARRLTKTLLDQAHLSPFPLSARPVHWAYANVLHLYPLPTALVLADAEAPAFTLNYTGCCVMNPGRIVEGRRGEKARWVEYDVMKRKAVVKIQEPESRKKAFSRVEET